MGTLPRRHPMPSIANATFSPFRPRSWNLDRSEPVGGIETKMSTVSQRAVGERCVLAGACASEKPAGSP